MISEVYAMAPNPSAAPQGPNAMFQSLLFPVIVVVGIAYLMIFRPQKKQELAHKKMIDSLAKGDEVMTQSGIYGKVAGVTEKVITLEIADKVKIRVAKTAIAGKTSGTEAVAA